MTPTQAKLAVYGVAALLLWLLRPRAPGAAVPADPGRVVREIEIDALVGSRTFGERLGEYGANPAVDQNMYDLIERSNRLIAEDDGTPVAINGVD